MNHTYDSGTHTGLRRYFDSGATRTFEWRMRQLRGLETFLCNHEKEITDALYEDLRKSAAESWLSEISSLQIEIRHALRNLHKWMRFRRVSVPLPYLPGRAFVERDPLGVVLLLGTWNYPLILSLAPVVGAFAGGNCVVLKPSEMAPATSRLMATELTRYLDQDAFRVIEGDGETAGQLLEYHFNHIFFTGGQRVGTLVMQAAARYLTPVTLELGGKSPCIVTATADLRVAAKRIVWAKFMNAGQTCIAPDYLLVHESVEERLSGYLKETLMSFFGTDPALCPDYGRIVNTKAFRRLDAMKCDGTIVTGGVSDEERLYIAPTILRNIPADSRLMQEEIFGPLLPVLSFSSLSDVVGQLRSRPDPLALYLFSRDRAEQRYVKEQTRSGTLCCNDLLFQVTLPDLPFGGRGASGIGSYHGKAGFETFTAPRSVLHRGSFPDPVMRYPPYTGSRFALLKRVFSMFT